MHHRNRNGMNYLFLSVVWFGLLCMTLRVSGQSSAKGGEWRTYGADLASTRYRPLDQIDASNFNKLEVAWSFKTDSLGTRPEYKLEGTPLMINGVLYTTAGTRRSVVATGELLWVHERGRDTQNAQQHKRTGARVQRADWPASLDLQYHPQTRGIWERHLAEQFLGHQRQHGGLDTDLG